MHFEEDEIKILNRFLDDEKRIKIWPSKKAKQEIIYKYLSQRFEAGRIYTEHEINFIISSNHTFNDLFILRRGLIVSGYLERERDGSAYQLRIQSKMNI